MMNMTMPSTTILMVGMVVAVFVVGALYAAVRVVGARMVESDHPTRSRPADLPAVEPAKRRPAIGSVEG